MKNTMRYSLLFILCTILCTATVFAQQQQMPPQPEPLSPEEVTDEDLKMVALVSKAAQGIQQEADMKMKEVIEEEGMDYSRFQEIMMAQQNPQMAGQVSEMTPEEQQTLQEVQPELQQINQQAQQQYMGAIQEEGLTLQKFQQLAQAIQTHPEVAERFQKFTDELSDSDNG